jgi:hypothetical protein
VIVTVGNTKGGVGKTTLAVQLALARALAGRDVLVVDGDRQAGKYDDVMIDAGGRDSTALRAALSLSDLLIVPFLPRSVDVWPWPISPAWWTRSTGCARACGPMPCSTPPILARRVTTSRPRPL